jgi:hypothetical protein
MTKMLSERGQTILVMENKQVSVGTFDFIKVAGGCVFELHSKETDGVPVSFVELHYIGVRPLSQSRVILLSSLRCRATVHYL